MRPGLALAPDRVCATARVRCLPSLRMAPPPSPDGVRPDCWPGKSTFETFTSSPTILNTERRPVIATRPIHRGPPSVRRNTPGTGTSPSAAPRRALARYGVRLNRSAAEASVMSKSHIATRPVPELGTSTNVGGTSRSRLRAAPLGLTFSATTSSTAASSIRRDPLPPPPACDHVTARSCSPARKCSCRDRRLSPRRLSGTSCATVTPSRDAASTTSKKACVTAKSTGSPAMDPVWGRVAGRRLARRYPGSGRAVMRPLDRRPNPW